MASSKGRGLGKGFQTLIPKDFDSTLLTSDSERVRQLALDEIVPNAEQPRRHFEDEALRQLADSLKQYGVVQPIIVTPHGKQYQIIAGERRWRAAGLAGLKTLPAIVRSSKELEQLEIALVENVQRVDLSPLEQALSIERLHQQFNQTYETIARRLGKAVSTINNSVRLLQLPDTAKQALHEQKISEGHARQILALKDLPAQQADLLRLIIAQGWSVRQAERYVTASKASAVDTKATELQSKIQSETPETKRLSRKLGVPISIRRTARGGKLEIGFSSNDQLTQLIDLLKKL